MRSFVVLAATCVALVAPSGCILAQRFLRQFSAAECSQNAAVFEVRVAPVLTRCERCHSRDGLAAGTRLHLVQGESAEVNAANMAALNDVTGIDADGQPLLLQKATATTSHGGGEQVAAGSDDYQSLADWVERTRSCADVPGADGVANAEGAVDPPSTFVGARIRRLSAFELERSLSAVLGGAVSLSGKLASDARQQGFSNNAAQVVDVPFATQWRDVAEALATEATSSASALANTAPCSSGDEASCADDFIVAFASRAYRRAPTTEEVAALRASFTLGRQSYTSIPGSYAAGIELVIAAVLQSPAFLYTTELGEPLAEGESRAAGTSLTLSAGEIASALSYFLIGGPPDDELYEAAANGGLATPEGRRSHAERLLARDDAVLQARRFAGEWLGVDGIDSIVRHAPSFTPNQGAVLRDELETFASSALLAPAGSFSALLAGPAPSSVATARTLITHPALMARYAHDDETAPVQRGTFVMRRLLCRKLEAPLNVAGALAPPPVNPNMTTRERVAAQGAQAACSTCHSVINPIGFLFEGYDQAGAARATDNGKPIDSSGGLTLGGEALAFASAAEASVAIAASKEARECVARMLYRFGSAQAEELAERKVLALLDANPALLDGSPRTLLVELAASELFVTRRQP